MLPPATNTVTSPRAGVLESYHVRFKLLGKRGMSRDDIEATQLMYFDLLKTCDRDFPIDPLFKPTTTIETCEKCKGWIWRQPTFTPKMFKAGAQQVGLRAKVHCWRPAEKCGAFVIERPVFTLAMVGG